MISSPAAISCGTACASQSASFISGTSVVLTATAAPGYTFNGWSGGGCSGSQATCTVTVNAATSVSATFAPIQWTVTGSAPGGNGTVTCTSPVDNGTTSTCTITPSAGYQLSGLTDAGVNVFASVSGGSYTTAGGHRQPERGRHLRGHPHRPHRLAPAPPPPTPRPPRWRSIRPSP